MLYRFKSHPAPGYYDKTGTFVTVGDLKVTGTMHRVRSNLNNPQEVTANGGIGAGGGGGFGVGTGGGFDSGSSSGFGGGAGGMAGGSSANVDRYNPVRDRLDEGSVIEDWIPRDASGLDEMFRLMYHRDHIAGTIVDLIADLIWSDYDLVGIEDPAIKRIFEESMSAIDIVATMPDITREFLVLGRTVSSMIFDKDRGIFKDLVSHDPSFVRLTPIPLKGFDPKIDLIPSPSLRAFVDSQDPRDIDARKILPEAFIKAVRASSGNSARGYGGMSGSTRPNQNMGHGAGSRSGGIPLDPINTLFIPRRVFNYDMIGTSLYTRLISFWALEKALINATMTSARRRSRSILHVKVGIDDKWEPTAEEVDNIAGMFIQADEDPVGAVVATRTGVDANEIRDGQNFYKWSDEWQLLTEGKLRALGANDALLTGDATYSNQETAKAFFMEKAAALRNSLTQRIFLKRLFPLVARIHGFKKRSQAELSHKIRIGSSTPKSTPNMSDSPGADILTQRQALEIPESDLILPTIQWRKELLLQIDEKRLEIYEKMQDVGVPITLRNWASAANVDLDSQIADLDADAELRKRVAAWKGEYENVVDNIENEAKLEFVKSLQSLSQSNLKQVLGEAESRSLGPLSQYIFWSKEGTMGPLKAKELAKFIDSIDPNTNSVKILIDSNVLSYKLNQEFRNPITAEIAHYLLYRTGFAPAAPVLSPESQSIVAESVSLSLDKYANHGGVYKLGKIAEAELKIVNSLSVKKKRKALDSIEKTAAKTYASLDKLPQSSSFLYSGTDK